MYSSLSFFYKHMITQNSPPQKKILEPLKMNNSLPNCIFIKFKSSAIHYASVNKLWQMFIQKESQIKSQSDKGNLSSFWLISQSGRNII